MKFLIALLISLNCLADTPSPYITSSKVLDGSGNPISSTGGHLNLHIDNFANSYTAPLQYTGSVVSIPQATSSVDGYLLHADWATFNAKQPAGSYITALTSDVSASGPGSSAATVNSVGGSSAANIHSAELAANAATDANTASTIVKRDASGNFTAGAITANLTGNLTGNASGSAASITGVNPIANGGTNNSSAYTSGSLIYSDGTKLTQDNANLFYDSTNKRLGVNTPVPINHFSVMPSFYSTGTASQSGTTVTGSGTSWGASAVGAQLIYANGVSAGIISAVTDTTHLTVSTSQTVGSQAYSINSIGLQVSGGSMGTAGSQGLVSIGLPTPTDTLSIGSTSDGWTEILFDSTGIPGAQGGPGGGWNIGTGYSGYGNIKNFYIDDTVNGAGTAAFVINSSGFVGLTQMTPTARLDVNGYIRSTGNSVTTGTFTKTSSAALAGITGLSATVTSGKTYQYEIELYTTSGTSGGIKVDLNGGNASMTSITGMALAVSGTTISVDTRVAALNTSLCAVTAVTAANCRITGSFVVNAGGTFIPEFAQNVSNGTSSTVVIGSYMKLTQL